MNKFKIFVHKYGIVFHLSTLVFWLYLLYQNYTSFQAQPTIETKIAVIAAIVLLVLSSYNLFVAVRRLKK